jgi:hypothetical protein
LKRLLSRARPSGRHAIVCALILAVGIPAVAVGAGEGRNLVLGKRNPKGGELTRETEIISRNGTYSTRQSNLRTGDGGGAIYGCRSAVGREPCVRANNLNEGRAFEFEVNGPEGGRIEVEERTAAPFSTNAQGKVTNLNADQLDGRDSESFANEADLLFAAVADGGTLLAGQGATTAVKAANATTVTFNRDVSKCSFTATANGATPQALAVQAAAGQPTQAIVTEDAADPAVAFHLQVIC